jgi:hypothetical protein
LALVLLAVTLSLVALVLSLSPWWTAANPATTSTSTQGGNTLAAGAGGTTQDGQKELKRFRQDFRGRNVNAAFFLFTGPNARQLLQTEPAGLRVSLPADNTTKPQPTGLVTKFRVQGDCEITLAYELLEADRPARGPGVGVTLYVVTDTPTKETVLLGRVHQGDGHHYICSRATTDAAGKRRFSTRPYPTEARSGQLRLVRRGAVVSYQVAEDNKNEFRELQQLELGTEDLVTIRAAADPGQLGSRVDVRIPEFEIRAQNVPEVTGDEVVEPVLQPPAKGWSGAAVFLGLLGTLSVAGPLGIWLYLRQRRRAEQRPAGGAVPESRAEPKTPASLPCQCSGCGKKYRVRAELAGKRARCAQCGKAVLVPALTADEAGGTS